MRPVEALEPFAEQVYRRLLDAISRCELRPGQKIPQAEVAASFGVSRQPVSHALHLLRQQGLIEISGKKGLAVSAVQVNLIRDLYQIRGQLDSLAASLAAQRVHAGHVHADALDAIHATLERAHALGEHAAIGDILEVEMTFHRQIYALSGNPSIEQTLAAHWPHLCRAMSLIHSRRTTSYEAHGEHEAILAAIASGDAERAAYLAQAHTNRACIEVASRLESQE